MKLGSLGWDVLDQYDGTLANHRSHGHSHWSGEPEGRAAISTYMDLLDWPQVLGEPVRNASTLTCSAIQLNTQLSPVDYSSTN